MDGQIQPYNSKGIYISPEALKTPLKGLEEALYRAVDTIERGAGINKSNKAFMNIDTLHLDSGDMPDLIYNFHASFRDDVGRFIGNCHLNRNAVSLGRIDCRNLETNKLYILPYGVRLDIVNASRELLNTIHQEISKVLAHRYNIHLHDDAMKNVKKPTISKIYAYMYLTRQPNDPIIETYSNPSNPYNSRIGMVLYDNKKTRIYFHYNFDI